MIPDPPCLLDGQRPCGGCAAPTQAQCPYAYLLQDTDEQEPARYAEDASRRWGPPTTVAVATNGP